MGGWIHHNMQHPSPPYTSVAGKDLVRVQGSVFLGWYVTAESTCARWCLCLCLGGAFLESGGWGGGGGGACKHLVFWKRLCLCL